ncbi:Uncharacterised protein [Mycobacteroides abscessus subsp. abscessus]|nr:Uncharacterised protein [Mycobacteroides abscessus subsp. abscessus]
MPRDGSPARAAIASMIAIVTNNWKSTARYQTPADKASWSTRSCRKTTWANNCQGLGTADIDSCVIHRRATALQTIASVKAAASGTTRRT